MATSADDIKQLKAMIAIAKKEPVSFAVCMGSKPEGAVMVMHKIRPPEALAREAKTAGETPKVAYGTISIDGIKATLKIADKVPTGLGKHLRAFFKSVDIAMKVELTDPTGKPFADEGEPGDTADGGPVPEASAPAAADPAALDPAAQAWAAAWATAEPRVRKALEKDGAETAKIKAVRDFTLGKADAGQFEAAQKSLATLLAIIAQAGQMPAPTPAQTPVPAPDVKAEAKPASDVDRADLIKRMADAKTRLAAVPGPMGEKLTEGFVKAVDMVKAGNLDAAAGLLAKVEAALGKIEGAKATATSAPTEAKPAEVAQDQKPEPTLQPAPEPQAEPDPKLAGITASEVQLRKDVTSATGGDVQKALLAVLDRAQTALAAGEADAALAAIKRVQDGLKLQAEVDRLAPLVAKAASSGKVANVNALTMLFNTIAEKIPASDQARALAALARVEDMIAAGATQDKTTHDQDAPLENRPYVEARINWGLTRTKLRDEITRLEAGIATVLAREGLDGDVQVAGALTGYLDKLDARLEAKLADLVNADTDDLRAKLKADASGLIAEYTSELDTDFFRDVDGNGFVPVAIASTARAVLKDLSKVLAA